jgi:hypothetical protein
MKVLLRLLVVALVATAASAQCTARCWDIGAPVIGYRGMQLALDYTVKDLIQEEDVKVELFENADCTRQITDDVNNFIVTDLLADLTAPGDGSEARTVSSFVRSFQRLELGTWNRISSTILYYTRTA